MGRSLKEWVNLANLIILLACLNPFKAQLLCMAYEAFSDVTLNSPFISSWLFPLSYPKLSAMLLCPCKLCSFGCDTLPPLVNLMNLITFKTQPKLISLFYLLLTQVCNFVYPWNHCLLLKLLFTIVITVYFCNYFARAGTNLFMFLPQHREQCLALD